MLTTVTGGVPSSTARRHASPWASGECEVGPRADIHGSVGVARLGNDNAGSAGIAAEGLAQVLGGDPPRVGREIDERVDQRVAGALLHQGSDQPVGVDAVGGAEIGHAEHGLIGEQASGGKCGRVGRLERGALGERVARVVRRHAREFGAL